MRRIFLLCVLAVLATPPVAAAADGFTTIEDRFLDLPMDSLQAHYDCSQNNPAGMEAAITFDLADDSFTFSEGQTLEEGEPLPQVPAIGASAARAVCATVDVVLAVPPGTDHVHVRFDAARAIQDTGRLGAHMPQELRLYDGLTDRRLAAVDVFPWDDPTHPRTRFANLGDGVLGYFHLPMNIEKLRIEWFFEDQGQSFDQGEPGVVSGQGFSAQVWNPVIEFSSRPKPVTDPSMTERRDGLTIFSDTGIPIPYYPEGNQTNWRVRAPLNSVFSHVETPDGRQLDHTGSLSTGGEYGPDLDFIVVDRFSAEGYLELTLPDRFLAAHGPGEYLVVFRETSAVSPSAGIMTFNAALAAIPLAFAAMALQRIREFQREAFGGYRRTARNLMVTLILVLAYYLAAMLGAILAGWFTVAARLPLTTDSALLYLQVALAMAAFWWLWLTGREMYRIVRPPPAKARKA